MESWSREVERRHLLPPSASRHPPPSYHPITVSAANDYPITTSAASNHPSPLLADPLALAPLGRHPRSRVRVGLGIEDVFVAVGRRFPGRADELEEPV